MIGQTISHYRIISKLGEGGMGVVYKAADTKLDRTVVLKFLAPELTRDPEAKARFIHEAKAAAALSHTNICTIHEIDEFEGQSFIAMECYEGGTLGQRIAQGPLPLAEAVDIGRQIAQGLAKAHEQGIVHRDIKPANIFITSDGPVKILDFGLAKLSSQTRLTKTGTILGTAAYFSPEQARGSASDHRSDIWALGVTLYAMVTGQLPFKGEYEALAYSILNEVPEPLTGVRTGVPRDLERIVNKCMEKDAGERYQTAADLIADLRRLKRAMTPVGQEPATTRTIEKGRATVTNRTGKRLHPGILVALAVLVVVIAIVIYRPFFPSIDSQPTEGRKMLVVLPFESLGRSDDAYFADGISEEITSRLATLPELGVISRTSALHYRETDKTIRQIGEELGVDYVLEGTVRWDHEQGRVSRVRITPQLIRVSDDTHLWADRYDRDLKDIFEVQSDIAKQVVEQLDITLLEGQSRALEAKSTENLDAHQAYLRGLHHRQYMSASDQAQVQAQAMFERAVDLDPGFARAYAELSIVHSWLYYSPRTSSQEHLALAKAAADSALKIQPDLPEAHLALGYYWGNRDNDAALKEFAIAREGLPNDFRVFKLLGFTQHRGGDLEAALVSYKEAFELSPMDAEMAFHITFVLTQFRRYEEAIAYCDRAISLTPDFTGNFEGKAKIYWLWKGDTELARAVLEQMPETNEPDWTFYTWYRQELYERNYERALEQVASLTTDTYEEQLYFYSKSQLAGLVYYLMGDSKLARTSFESAKDLLEAEAEKRPDDSRIHSSLGMVYAGLGRKDDAIREGKLGVELSPREYVGVYGTVSTQKLAFIYVIVGEYDAALDQIEHILSVTAHFSIGLLRLDPRWEPLRDHPRYNSIVEKYSGNGT